MNTWCWRLISFVCWSNAEDKDQSETDNWQKSKSKEELCLQHSSQRKDNSRSAFTVRFIFSIV